VTKEDGGEEEEKDAVFPVVLTNIEHSLGRWVCLLVAYSILINHGFGS